MKKIILSLIALALSVGFASAQDMAQATDTYNSGAAALSNGEKASALEFFTKAIKEAEACGDEGAEIIANCKGVIPSIVLSIAKDLVKEADYTAAFAKIDEAAKVAAEYASEEVATEAAELLPQVKKLWAKSLYDKKDFAAAVDAYKEVLTLDAEDGASALRLAMALANSGAAQADVIAAYEKAATLGQEANANKQIASIYLKDAAAQLKAKAYAAAAEAAKKANEYGENAQAYLVLGQASQQLKKNAEAIPAFEKYLELSPSAKNAGAIALTIGALYQGDKNNAKALEFYKKAQELGTDAKQYIDALSK